MIHTFRIILLVALLLIGASTSTIAQANYFTPTEVGTSAEMIGRANIEGFSDTAEVLFDNPASLHRIKKFSASLFTTTFLDEITYQSLALAYNTGDNVIGIAYMSAGVNDIIKTDQNQNEDENPYGIIVPNGTYKYLNEVVKVGYQFSQTKRLHWGVAGSYFQNSIDTVKGSGYNVDAGLKYDGKKVDTSLAIKNILPGYDVSYSGGDSDGKTETLPMEIVWSTRATLGSFNLFGQIKSGGRSESVTKSGAISYRPSFFPFIELIAGYKEFGVLDTINNNTTLGVGLDLKTVKFNYAIESSEHIKYDKKHYFSIGIKF